MSLLKKRSFAVVIFVLVVVVFTLIGSHMSLTRACEKAEAAFFDKSLLQSEDYHTCPGDQLENCVDLGARLLSVIGDDGPWEAAYGALSQSRRALADALDDQDIPAIGAADQAFAEAVEAVKAAAQAGAPIRDSSDDYDAIISDLDRAQAILDDPAYNEHIQAFRDKELNAFPAGILRRLTGVKAPETFP